MTAEIPIPERISVQEAQEMLSAVQQVLQVRRIAVDPGRRMIFLRDQPGTILAARQILTTLSRNRAQVDIEVELLAVSTTSNLMYGTQLQNTASLLSLGTFLNNNAATASGSSADSIFQAHLTAVDGQAASLKVGEKYPILTSAFIGPAGAGANTGIPPAVQFQDLGLVLKITPTVQANGEVTLDVDAQQTALSGSTNDGIPIITSSHFQGMTRLVDGESAIIAGLMQTNISDTRSGYPWLSNVPILGRLFTSTTKALQVGETLIVLKPRLLSLPPWEIPSPVLWVGTETRPLSLY